MVIGRLKHCKVVARVQEGQVGLGSTSSLVLVKGFEIRSKSHGDDRSGKN